MEDHLSQSNNIAVFGVGTIACIYVGCLDGRTHRCTYV